jgi:hypothetical protein
MQFAGSSCGRPVSHVAGAGRACVRRSGQAVYGFHVELPEELASAEIHDGSPSVGFMAARFPFSALVPVSLPDVVLRSSAG